LPYEPLPLPGGPTSDRFSLLLPLVFDDRNRFVDVFVYDDDDDDADADVIGIVLVVFSAARQQRMPILLVPRLLFFGILRIGYDWVAVGPID